jgi:hypothetical protein
MGGCVFLEQLSCRLTEHGRRLIPCHDLFIQRPPFLSARTLCPQHSMSGRQGGTITSYRSPKKPAVRQLTVMKINRPMIMQGEPAGTVERSRLDTVLVRQPLTVYQLLANGIKRPGEMVRSVEGLTTKVLNECLRKNDVSAHSIARLTRNIHDSSSRKRADAKRDGHSEAGD